MPQLLPLLPVGARLIEPFVGAGSVFLSTDYESYIINDANSDLIAMWAALQARPREYIGASQSFFIEDNRNQLAYLRIRADFNRLSDRFERAIRLPYLNRFGFNGLFRVNSRGEFNVPYGKPARLPNLPVDEMAAASLKLQRCTILSGGYVAALELAGAGDVVYCDPPYLRSEHGESFSAYTGAGFGLAEHHRLLECCAQAVERGAHVLISNHDTPEVRELYTGWHHVDVLVRRSVGSTSGSRRMTRELVAVLPTPADTSREFLGSSDLIHPV